MKVTFIFAYIFFLVELAFPKSVSKKDINQIATDFIKWRKAYSEPVLGKQIHVNNDRIEELTDSQYTVLAYIVHVEPKGFIVASASTDIEPIIAYSFRHNWSSDTSDTNGFYKILIHDLIDFIMGFGRIFIPY